VIEMNIIPPKKIDFHAEKVSDDDIWETTYTEWFDPDDEVMANSKEIAGRMGLNAEWHNDHVTLTTSGPRKHVFDGFVGEFIFMSGIGDVTLQDIIIQAAIKPPRVMARRVVKPQMVEK